MQTVEAGPIVAGGSALVRRKGHKTMFVEGALPGETVDVHVAGKSKDIDKAVVESVVTPSARRINPPCPMFVVGCGGCQWQHASLDAQHEFKTGIVRDSLTRIAKRADILPHFAGSVPQFGYRTTMRLGVVDGRAALRRRHSNEMIPLDVCLIAHPILEELIREGSFGDATEVTLRASATTGERIAIVDGSIRGLKLPSDVIVTDGNDATLTEEVCGHTFRISAFSFFQSGHAAAELLAQTVKNCVPHETDWLIDAYAGVGLLGSVAGAKRITAIELDESSAEDARFNLRDHDAEVIEAEVAEVSLSSALKPDVAIADPSRTGLGKKASRTLISLGAKTLVLVSCDPASFARDVVLLEAGGYQLQSVDVLDLFPQTHHVETVSMFTF